MPPSPAAAVTSLNDPPFYLNPAIGDLVIRSSDEIDFHVHQDIFTHTSPTFSTMLALSKATSNHSIDAVSGNPLIHVVEDSAVWAYLVPFIYLPCPPKPALDASQLDLIRAILDAARKYNIPSMIGCMCGVLKSPAIVVMKPVSVYAVACAYELEHVARIAARQSLSEPLGAGYVQELDLISTRTFNNLLAYRSVCIGAALEGLREWSSQNAYSSELKAATRCECKTAMKNRVSIRKSWTIYMEKLERSLEQIPDAAKAGSQSLLGPVTTSAENCHLCLKKIGDDITFVSSGLEQGLKKAIDKVLLEF